MYKILAFNVAEKRNLPDAGFGSRRTGKSVGNLMDLMSGSESKPSKISKVNSGILQKEVHSLACLIV